MSMKLPLVLLTATLIGGGFAASLRDKVSLPGLPANVAATVRSEQERVAQQAVPADPQALAQQILTVQPAGQGAPDTAVPPAAMQEQAQLQPKTREPDQAGDPAPPAAEPKPEPDLSALRYFAARGDNARLQAEIARLRALYPDWTPPANPLEIPMERDERLEEVWRQYAEGRYSEVRKAIAERQATDRTWQPPQDLLERLNLAENRVRLINASDLKQYQTVITLAAEIPALRTCSDVDVLWRLAEAFIRTDRETRGVDVYRYVLENCTVEPQRVATIQKAAALLSSSSLTPLLALEREKEFEPIRNDLARRLVATANGTPGSDVAPDYLERLRRMAEAEGKASDALLLGWYALRHDEAKQAEQWFSKAGQIEKSVSASQGLALSLLKSGQAARAEDVMYPWRDSSEEASATYLAATSNLLASDPPLQIATEILQRIARTALQAKYVPTAQQLGWYARAFNQPHTAARWFETALQWKADEPSAYGLAITRQQLNDRAGTEAIRSAWAGRSQRIADLGIISAAKSPQLAPEPAQQSGKGDATRSRQTNAAASVAVSRQSRPTTSAGRTTCDVRSGVENLLPQAALQRGWCLMDLNRPLEAAEAFQAALGSSVHATREDAAYGQSLAYLRLGLIDKAAVAATKAPQSMQRSSELQVAILANRANLAFDAGRYREALIYLDQRALLQPETTDLLVLRGYAFINLNRASDAMRIFEAVAETGNRDAARGLRDARVALGLETTD
ncbi:tetratricopeptide repeat protein [Neorhizobium galegae]|nr:tetratricopeptide repeat protein [Neorhizobium galegae]